MATNDPFSDFSDNPFINIQDGKIRLTEDQKNEVIQFWQSRPEDPPTLGELVSLIYKKEYDVRSKPGLAIRSFLSEMNLKPRSLSTDKQDRKEAKAHITALTDGQKEYIVQNIGLMKPMKIARYLYANDRLTPLDKEFRLVNEFCRSLDPKIAASVDESDETFEYNPPKHLVQAAARVNKYVYENQIKPEQWKTNSAIKSQLESLIKFCHHDRFLLIANKIEEKPVRNLFEGSFVRYVWDKVDLTAEELDLYIDICQDIVMDDRIADEITINTRLLENAANEVDNKKFSVSISEHIKNLRSEAADNKERRKKAIENLQGKRSERVENRNKENDSLSALVDFVKQKDKRERLIKTLELKQSQLKDEVKRVEDMDDIIMEIYGVSQDEIIYGKI